MKRRLQPSSSQPDTFYYFAYGSCMCPTDLARSLGEATTAYVIGAAKLKGYRLGFYYHSRHRNCGCLDVIKDPTMTVEGVLYALPWRLSDRLDEREEVAQGSYRHEAVTVQCQSRIYPNVRTYVVINKLAEELAPSEWYLNVVLRGATTGGLSPTYCQQLLQHMQQLQTQQCCLPASALQA